MRAKDVVKELKRNGWVEARQTGSHLMLKKDGRLTVIPMHTGDLAIGTLKSIEKQTGVKLR